MAVINVIVTSDFSSLCHFKPHAVCQSWSTFMCKRVNIAPYIQ